MNANVGMNERLFAVGLEQLSLTVARNQSETKDALGGFERQLAELHKHMLANSDALGQAFDRIETAINQREIDQFDGQRFVAQIEQKIGAMAESLKNLRKQFLETSLETRLAALEQAMAASSKQDDVPANPPADETAGAFRPGEEVPDFAEPPEFQFESKTADETRSCRPAFEELFTGDQTGPGPFHSALPPGLPQRSGQRYFFPIAAAVLAIAALATGLTLTERTRPQPSEVATTAPEMRTLSLPEPVDSMPKPPQQDAAVNALPKTPDTLLNPADALPKPPGDFSETLFVVAPKDYARPQGDAKMLAPAATVKDYSPDQLAQMASTGNAAALTILGLRALDDRGAAPVNLADAVQFLTSAAQKGQPVAQFRLGSLYEHGDGMAADPAKAAHWYELAAGQGNRKAMHNLAVFYAVGALGKKNMPGAARWFAKAAGLGLADSQFNLAYLYERGEGVPKSMLDAYKWYAIAAAGGDKESKTRLVALQVNLSQAERANADRQAANFHPAPLNPAANVPPDAQDL